MNSRAGFVHAARLTFLLVFWPERFAEQESDDNARLAASGRSEQTEPRYVTVRRGLGHSFLWVCASGIVGFILGLLLGCLVGWTPSIVAWLQIGGAGILLWGILFVRGWEIQSFGGKTLSEQVNEWIYRFLQTIGTVIVVVSLSLPQCPS